MIVCDDEGIGADAYEDILYDRLFSLIDDILELPDDETIQVADENTFLFMHDNAPCHKAKAVLHFLAQYHVSIMKWPAQSLDLNLIENLWAALKEAFHKRFLELFGHPLKSLEARYRYGEVLQEVWYNQGMELVKALVESMPKRIQAVLKANGGWTKY